MLDYLLVFLLVILGLWCVVAIVWLVLVVWSMVAMICASSDMLRHFDKVHGTPDVSKKNHSAEIPDSDA